MVLLLMPYNTETDHHAIFTQISCTKATNLKATNKLNYEKANVVGLMTELEESIDKDDYNILDLNANLYLYLTIFRSS